MNKIDYNSQSELIINIIDIAIDCFTKNPPKEFEENHIKQFVNTYIDYRNKAINPEPQFRNLKSLKYIKNDVLIYFQEGTGKAVDIFWKEINEKQFGLVRVNRFEKVLKRGKINNQIEYDMIIDLYNSYIETNMLSSTEINKLNDLISNFEKSK